MRRLISFILLIAVFWGGWQLFLYQARPQKEAVGTIGATLPLSGTNAETGLAAQDALNLALKEWNSRQNRYRYRIFYLDDSGKAEQTQKNLLTLLEKQNAAAKSIGPPETKITGIFNRREAINIPGVILSQLEIQTMASAQWALTIYSTESAISSRDGSE